MNTINLFRSLILAQLAVLALLLVFGVVSGMGESSVPPEVTKFLEGPAGGVMTHWMQNESTMWQALAAVFGVIALFILACIGLLMLKSWARILYIALAVLDLVTYPLQGYTLTSWQESLLGEVGSLLGGAVLVLLFVEPVSTRFRTRAA